MNTDDTDSAWAAGILDGEGGFFIPPQGGVRIEVEQRDPRMLVRLQNILRGATLRRRRNRNIWRLSLTGDDAMKALHRVEPYLSAAKAEQAGVLGLYRRGGLPRDEARALLRRYKHGGAECAFN